jgi:hypothetical protein
LSRAVAAALGLFAAAALLGGCGTSSTPSGSSAPTRAVASGPSFAALESAHARDAWVECSGTVERVLRDDTRPPRHERFIVRVDGASGQTLLVAHNIDLAPRAPLAAGDHVDMRGEYEWTAQGGVLHETHHATSARATDAGWLRVRGVTYQ